MTVRSTQPAIYWLITRTKSLPWTRDDDYYIANIYDSGGALAVFSFEEEARMFAGSFDSRDGWQVTEVEGQNLLRILHGRDSGTDFVALDPLPENVAPEAANLVCVDREYFSHRLLMQIQQQDDSSLNAS